ncbi:MAG: hypothetical protein ABIT08_02435 [Bacteroidia bacterium]
MDSNTEDRVGTPIKVNQFLKDNTASFAINAQIEAERTTLENDTERIFQNDSIATRPLEGFTQMKTNARTDLENIVLLVRAGCVGYYTANPNPGKLMIVKFADTKVREARDNDLYVLADQVHDIADPIKALMAPYLVTAANVDSIPTRMTAYKNVLQLPRTEEAISIAAGEERDRLVSKCFDLTLKNLDNYLLPFKYSNEVLYSEYLTARAIDNSGGGADTNGYEVHNYEIRAGRSVSFGAAVDAAQQLYLRQIGGTIGVTICTGATALATCTSGFDLTPGTTLKTTFGDLGLPAGAFIIFTNPNAGTVTVRAGLKT